MTQRRWQYRARVLVLAIVLASGAGSALGADDGGGRSVFAFGAGNRALALGGAFAAVADDASAALWNPGGLGWVSRREFQATHTNLIGLGFNEQYASLVLPSWRWGVGAVTFRHFGVGGVEERDDRNLLLSDDLSDQELEIALGYGRSLGNAWSVGGAVKMQRQSLAGYSDTGIGLDLGLLVRPLLVAGSRAEAAENLTLGLAVRNAIEPAIRLDEESVPDPGGVRAGLAYTSELGANTALLAAIDIEKTAAMDSRFHAGLEARLYSRLAVRLGSNAGTLVAGTGVRWRDVTVDYAFEDSRLGSVHRVGVSLAFGPTTEESRRATLAAEEEALQAKLVRAFEARSRDRIAGLVAQAEVARNQNHYDEALEILATVKVLAPDHARAAELELTCLREKGFELRDEGDFAGAEVMLGRALSLAPDDSLAARGLAQVRAESDLRAARSSEIRQLFNDALDAFATDELLAARAGFRRVLDADPADAEAASMLRRTEEAIRHRAGSLVEQARALIQAEQYTAADSTLQRARQLDPEVRDLARVSALLASHLRVAGQEPVASTRPSQAAGASSSPAPPARRALSADERREITDFYRRGMAAIEQGRVDDAVRYWEFVWSLDPEYQRVAEYLKREYLTRGMEAFASGKLHEAVTDWERVLRIDPNDDRAIGYLERAREQQARIQKILGENQ